MHLDSEIFNPYNAALWASEYLGKNVTTANIIYLLNYGKIANHSSNPKENLISKEELKAYYDSFIKNSNVLNSPLSFAQYKEAQTTKHIHRLHPYKGKFIPQLVEYFLDSHIDFIKTQSCFKQGDIVLDLFCGSGTTLCVANELGMHAIGIEISKFNTMLSNAKIKKYDLSLLKQTLQDITHKLEVFVQNSNILEFESVLNQKIGEFNNLYFPAKEFKRKVVLKEIDEMTYSREKESEFLRIYNDLIDSFNINLSTNLNGNFFDKWYLNCIKKEIIFVKDEILKVPEELQEILMIILSRTARSCRATTHSDLATLKAPIVSAYYCKKHGRICKPLFSITKWWKSYCADTLKRLKEFDSLRSDSFSICINADSTNVDIECEITKYNKDFAKLVRDKKIDGIFSSPPYVGLIDYHEQHAYSYDIFSLPRCDELEIGKLKDGQGKIAQEKYAQLIAKALLNAKRFLKPDYDVLLVANDKFNLYPKIAELAGMKIIKTYERPVINRSEKDKNQYSENIFHLKDFNV